VKLLARDSLRIVHVEDDDHFAGFSEHSLQRAGFTQPIVRCKDGLLALHYFSSTESKFAPHAVLLDLHMPRMSGLEVLHWLRNSHSDQDVAVYLLTSSEERSDKEQAATDGVTEYLLKSHLYHELIKNLDQLIATLNNQKLENARNIGLVPSELGFMGKHSREMVASR